MTVALTSNFFANARGLTLTDGGGVVWAINKNTNSITATVAGATGGTVTSVGLADGSSTPLYAITNSPVTASGTLTFTLKTQSANLVLAGPSSGVAAQPTFRALVVADLPTGYPYADLTGAPSIPAAANPTGKVGLAAVNGSAATFMRSDGAPLLDVTISPTWTGNHVFAPSVASGFALQVTTKAGGGEGLYVVSGANSAYSVLVQDFSQAVNYFSILGDGSGTLGPAATLGMKWDASGNVTLSGEFAIHGGTPAAALAGFGTPTGTVTSGLSSSSTLAQTAGTLAAFLAYMKGIGFVAT